MQIIPSFDPSATSGGDIQVASVDAGAKILLYNLSLTTIELNFLNGSTDLLHAGEARYWTLDGTTPSIQWTKVSTLPGTPNSSQVTGTLYTASEPLPGTYPVALTYQTYSNGGTVTVTGVPATSIVNTSSPQGTNIINARVPGDPADAVNLDNTGHLTLGNANHTGILDLVYPGMVRWLTNPNNPSPNQWNATTDFNNTLHFNSASGVLGRQMIVDGLGPITLDAGNGMVNITQSSPPTFNGTGAGSGTVTAYQDLGGTLKHVVLYQNNFKNAGAALNVPLIVPFTTFVMWRVTDNSGWSLLKNGVAQSIRPFGASNGGPGTTVTTFTVGWNNGDCLSGVDTVQYTGGGSAAHNGILELIGV